MRIQGISIYVDVEEHLPIASLRLADLLGRVLPDWLSAEGGAVPFEVGMPA